jgi:hypothetical protein
VRFPFVELVFTHGLGPPPGRYVVRPEGVAAPETPTGNAIQTTLPLGSADVLIVRIDGAAPVAGLLRRRRKAVAVDARHAEAEVSLYTTTLVFGTRGLPDVAAAEAALAGWQDDIGSAQALALEALAVVNRAVRAYRAAAADPYLVEVTASDPRTIRIGYGTAEVSNGIWEQALMLPRAPARRVPWGERLRPVGTVADVLAGRDEILDGEDVLLRAVLDLEQGRPAIAARQLELAIDVLSAAPGAPVDRFAALAAELAEVRRRLGDDTAAAVTTEQLTRIATDAGDAVDRWRAAQRLRPQRSPAGENHMSQRDDGVRSALP